MQCWKSLALLWAWLSSVQTSGVWLNGSGYEDLLIGIHPAVPENYSIIENIKTMVAEASSYMFNATQKGLYFRSVKILLPLTWQQHSTYSRPRTESVNEVDVIVAEPFLKYGDDPYTLQYRGCGEKGKYIHFTPNFMINDKLISVFGPRGRVFVHEWAHLRWGIFDEYSSETPFYVSSSFQVEATRCAAGITGSSIFHKCEDKFCSFRTCSSDPHMEIHNKGCKFLPDKNQNATGSIMYMQALSSVVAFCNASTHNSESPNLQNRMCRLQSAWDVMMRSSDFSNISPSNGMDSPPAPTFSLLQIKHRVVCLVLDVSDSMNQFDRISRQRQAAELFLLQIIETGSYVGIVSFSQEATAVAKIRQILSEAEREELAQQLPAKARGGTNICKGIRVGFKEIGLKIKSTPGSEIVLLTDGEDPKLHECLTEVKDSGAIVHTIALGPKADSQLETFSRTTGGLMFSAKDNFTSTELIDAFSGLSSGNGNISQQAVQMESISFTLYDVDCRKGAVSFDSTVGKNTFFVVTWQHHIPLIKVYDPYGKEYPQTNFSINVTIRTARLQIPGIAKAGDWIYSLCNTESPIEIIGLTVTTHPANDSNPPITVKVHMNEDTNTFPAPMVVYADVSQGYSPVLGANVTAIIEPQTGEPVILSLKDNGAGNIQMNPARPSVSDDIETNLEKFSRTASGGSFTVSEVPTGPLLDIFSPCAIFDLAARLENGKIELSWTAPGDDLDQGRASRYQIRMSGNPGHFMANFNTTTSIDVSSLTPKVAGSLETIIFAPEELALQNEGVTYFAVRATDEAGSWSEISNIAQVALIIPKTPIPTSPSVPTEPPASVPPSTPITCRPPVSYHSTSAPPPIELPQPITVHIPTVVITVSLVVVIICLAISITLCFKQDEA
ncbi:calcium-activated chloride channel regulator 1-like isoform X2 [Lissotriton helveticus]